MSPSSHAGSSSTTITPEQALWSGHGGGITGKMPQADRVLAKLRECRALGVALGLPTIMRELGVAQHGARLRELRQRGHIITNHMTRAADGTICSSYTLDHDAEPGR